MKSKSMKNKKPTLKKYTVVYRDDGCGGGMTLAANPRYKWVRAKSVGKAPLAAMTDQWWFVFKGWCKCLKKY